MQTLFSTAGVHPRDSFKRWRDMLFDLGANLDQQRLDDGPFDGKMEATRIGSVAMHRVSQGAQRSEATGEMLRNSTNEGMVVVMLQLAGAATTDQDGRNSAQRPGDFVVIDQRPVVMTTRAGSTTLSLQLPRERLENVLGSTRLYTALTVGSDLASATLVSTFFRELIRVQHKLPPAAAARMASAGTDLIVASIAERLAREIPRPLHGTVVVQRAKAYVETHLGDMTLDPPQLAAAVGVSLRRLQELFHGHGQHISDWIWQRRLETAAQRLTDPGHAHLPIGTLAYGCGFASQAHFARRFKAQYGMTPSAYRAASLFRAS
ncbi:helix-turn-helix domain-containing protein [Methylobacterium pseudosasicola]|uniref:Transcriptional regulator, AraC family n=1 Tax=Methylobacterium pseudosasicola TaxID=582667 RepID=A0A1I4NLV5_9HYPH|nr:helix-turn-helix domain-containing protein [Methylobacterium pseudosasicola]SFM16522.1 transcriptional regulator, AraC family [Methylobacterium pseudosasicola]